MPIEFEWDTNKAKSNLHKHGIRFESGAKIIRIISAREADSKEMNRYEHG
jgi:uncharacterized DUF497 family protein